MQNATDEELLTTYEKALRYVITNDKAVEVLATGERIALSLNDVKIRDRWLKINAEIDSRCKNEEFKKKVEELLEKLDEEMKK